MTGGDAYDSALVARPFAGPLGEIWGRRRLLRVLVARDLILRYKRSLLGVWWTLLNPLLRMVVMWAVLSSVFRPEAIGVPYVVYLLSGLVVVIFFEQSVLSAGCSLVNSTTILSKVYVPPQLFALSAVLAAGATLLVSLAVLAVIQLAVGVSLPVTALLLPVPVLSLLMLGTGVGLLVAAAAVRVHDVVDFMTVVLQLTAFVTPTFYPLASVSEPWRSVIEVNPLTQVVLLLRAVMYEGTLPGWPTWVAAIGAGAGALLLGAFVLARSWRGSAAML